MREAKTSMKRLTFFTTLLFWAGTVAVPAAPAEPIRVVATTRTLASLVQEVGGALVEVHAVAPAKQNVHFIQPRPSDVLKLTKANLFVHAGLDLELWRFPFAEASGKSQFLPGGARELALSEGIELLEVPTSAVSRAQGDIHLYGNPHYWLDPRNGAVMARAIASKLSELYPGERAGFEANAKRFEQALDEKLKAWQAELSPARGAVVVAYHNSWPYLARFAGFEVVGFVEPKPGIPPTAKHLGQLERVITERAARVILKEPYQESRAPKQLAERTGARVVTLAQNVGDLKEATDFLSLFDANVRLLAAALKEPHG